MTAQQAALRRLEDRLLDDLHELSRHDPETGRTVLAQVSRRLEQEQDRRAWGDHRRDSVLEILEALPEGAIQ